MANFDSQLQSSSFFLLFRLQFKTKKKKDLEKGTRGKEKVTMGKVMSNVDTHIRALLRFLFFFKLHNFFAFFFLFVKQRLKSHPSQSVPRCEHVMYN